MQLLARPYELLMKWLGRRIFDNNSELTLIDTIKNLNAKGIEYTKLTRITDRIIQIHIHGSQVELWFDSGSVTSHTNQYKLCYMTRRIKNFDSKN